VALSNSWRICMTNFSKLWSTLIPESDERRDTACQPTSPARNPCSLRPIHIAQRSSFVEMRMSNDRSVAPNHVYDADVTRTFGTITPAFPPSIALNALTCAPSRLSMRDCMASHCC
jgi:hypothetical protein